MVNLHAKLEFLAQTVPEIWRGSQNLKSRSRDSFPTPFDLIYHLVPPVVNLHANWKFLAQTVPEIYRESQI